MIMLVVLGRFLASPSDDDESCRRTSKFWSSANFASRILAVVPFPVLDEVKSSVDMAWEYRSRARWDILWAWLRRWMCKCAGVDRDESRMYVDMVSEEAD
jgi:hypothetical protein